MYLLEDDDNTTRPINPNTMKVYLLNSALHKKRRDLEETVDREKIEQLKAEIMEIKQKLKVLRER
jgi:hypothetical protein